MAGNKAYQAAAARLSHTHFFLSDYALRLLNHNQITELEKFTNGINYVDENHSTYLRGYEEGAAFGSDYLAILYSTTLYTLGQESVCFFMADAYTEEVLKELKIRNSQLADLTSYWSLQYQMTGQDVTNYKRKSKELFYGTEIKNLTYNKGFEFDCYYKSVWIKDATLKVDAKNIAEIIARGDFCVKMSTARNNNPSRQRSKKFILNHQSLEVQKDTLFAKYTVNTVLSLSGLIHPGLGALINGIVAISSGEVNKTQENAIDLAEKSEVLKADYYNANKLELRSAATVITAYLDYIKEQQSIIDEIEKNKFTDKVEWFGSAGSFNIDDIEYDAYEGLYNPDALMAVCEWEKDGLASLVPVTEEDLKEIRSKIKEGVMQDHRNEIELLLTGDPNNNAGILKMDQVVFEELVREIETAYDKADLGNNTSLQALFFNKTQGE